MLQIGTHRDRPDEPALVNAERLNRHTFWCGQSGSGKTYALGVLLERVLIDTRLPLVVLDPNSDFVRLDDLRTEAPEADGAALKDREIAVLREAGGPRGLRVRFVDLPLRSRAAILHLDPVADADEFNVLLHAERDLPADSDVDIVEWLRASGDPGLQRAAVRIENLGVADWPMWARGARSVGEVLDEQLDATIVDLGRFATHDEPRAAALAVLDHLWQQRADRIGRLIVIDEAHNLCPPDPITPLERLLTERIVQIAAEGRKYGLWLLLSTQRPSKIHPNVLSQCDNLVVMKTASTSDLAAIGDVFGHVPADLLREAPSFGQGEALIAGGFVAEPQLIRVGARLTPEGGSDVRVPLR